MLNFFYVYAGVWGSVLFLYVLGWSALNAALNPILLGFFLGTIVLSLALGGWFSKKYSFKEHAYPDAMPWIFVLLIFISGLIGIAKLGFIPLMEILHGSFNYDDMLSSDANLPKTIGVVGSVFGIGYQFARLQMKRCFADGLKLAFFGVILVLYASRGPILIAGTTCMVLMLAQSKFKLSMKRKILVCIVVICALWLFGAYGNIRTGFDWNDSSYIYLLGRFENRWPEWLPKEFCWAYVYLTSPLANLNYSMRFSSSISIINFIYDFIPLAIAKRLPFYSAPNAVLQVSYFNVSSVWSDYYIHLGAIGLFLGYLIQMLLMGLWYCVANRTNSINLMLAYCGECTIMSFFVNAYVYPTMGYPALILIAICIIQRVGFGRVRKRRIEPMDFQELYE